MSSCSLCPLPYGSRKDAVARCAEVSVLAGVSRSPASTRDPCAWWGSEVRRTGLGKEVASALAPVFKH